MIQEHKNVSMRWMRIKRRRCIMRLGNSNVNLLLNILNMLIKWGSTNNMSTCSIQVLLYFVGMTTTGLFICWLLVGPKLILKEEMD